MAASDEEDYTVWLHRSKKTHVSWVDGLQETHSGPQNKTLEHVGWLGLPSAAKSKEDVCVFHRDVVPMWEHVEHEGSGKLQLKISACQDTDSVWLRTLMMFFARSDLRQISGVCSQVAVKSYKVSLWFFKQEKSFYDREKPPAWMLEIANVWKNSLGLPHGAFHHIRFRTVTGEKRQSLVLEW